MLDCGWGRLIFAHTFEHARDVAKCLCEEARGRRDIALYLRDPHVVLSCAPQELFLDPSHTYRLWLSQFRPESVQRRGFDLRRLRRKADAQGIDNLYMLCHMVAVDPDFIWSRRGSPEFTYVVAYDRKSGNIIGAATGVDHTHAFADPENGSSLWCLAVDRKTVHSGVGIALVNYLASHYQTRGRSFMDLSVLHDNEAAIALYEKLGFQRVPVFCIKHKNPVNEKLFIGPAPEDGLNPYARIIVDEARRRGIGVNVDDAERGFFTLVHGGRRVACRESLSELTSAIAFTRCDDKAVTHELLADAGLNVPDQQAAGEEEDNADFLERHMAIVVKPARGEQGQGISVNLRSAQTVKKAIKAARQICDSVLLERYCAGEDLRIIVIGFQVVAAAVRRPPRVIGTGVHTIRELIKKQSRRRGAATGGESRIPLDGETKRCVAEAGYELEDVLPEEMPLTVRHAANLHTGGTIHDVTDQLHPELRSAAHAAARTLNIPVVGLDFMVESVDKPGYVIIEANERPGLANHEPQPTAERFVDLLFPLTAGWIGSAHGGEEIRGGPSPGTSGRKKSRKEADKRPTRSL